METIAGVTVGKEALFKSILKNWGRLRLCDSYCATKRLKSIRNIFQYKKVSVGVLGIA